jgi:hypothetical protein
VNNITRERFLQLIAAGGASFLGMKGFVQAQDPTTVNADTASAPSGPLIPWARLKFIGENGDDVDWHVHPQGDLNLIDSIRDETTVNLEKKWNIADVANLDSMVPYPFLFMHGEIAPVLSDNDRKNLAEYLMRGGFLFGEDCVNGYGNHGPSRLNDYFFRSMAADLPSLLPGSSLQKLPLDHPVFHCLYHFNYMPHMQGTPHGLHGLIYDGRVVALLSPSDLHCGWTNGDRWFGPRKREAAMQMGANIYTFAMTQST